MDKKYYFFKKKEKSPKIIEFHHTLLEHKEERCRNVSHQTKQIHISSPTQAHELCWNITMSTRTTWLKTKECVHCDETKIYFWGRRPTAAPTSAWNCERVLRSVCDKCDRKVLATWKWKQKKWMKIRSNFKK